MKLIHKSRLTSLLLWPLLWAQLAVAGPQAPLPEPEVELLPNGLTIAWYLDDRLPFVDFELGFRSGYREDPSGLSGLTEVLGATLDRGVAGMDAQALSDRFEELGASRGVSVDADTILVAASGLSQDASTIAELLAKLAMEPSFPQDEFDREKARILNRWRHLGDSASTLAGMALQRAAWGGSVYGRGNFLSAREFSRVKRADVLRQYRRLFRPELATLLVVGRADRTKLGAEIRARFGAWKGVGPAQSTRVRYSDPLFTAKGTAASPMAYVIHRPDASQTHVRLAFPAPGLKDPSRDALLVANALLGETFQSRLNGEIRDKLGLTYGIGSQLESAEEHSSFIVSAATRTESTGALVKRTLEILRELRAGKVTAEEVEATKEYLLGGFPLSVSTLTGVALRWMKGHMYKMGPDYLNGHYERFRRVDLAQVKSALRSKFKLEPLTIVAAGDAPGIEKSLRAAGVTRIQRVKVENLQR